MYFRLIRNEDGTFRNAKAFIVDVHFVLNIL